MRIIDEFFDLVSIGHLATTLQLSVRDVESLAEECKLAPSVRLDHIPYFDGHSERLIRARLAEKSR